MYNLLSRSDDFGPKGGPGDHIDTYFKYKDICDV